MLPLNILWHTANIWLGLYINKPYNDTAGSVNLEWTTFSDKLYGLIPLARNLCLLHPVSVTQAVLAWVYMSISVNEVMYASRMVTSRIPPVIHKFSACKTELMFTPSSALSCICISPHCWIPCHATLFPLYLLIRWNCTVNEWDLLGGCEDWAQLGNELTQL